MKAGTLGTVAPPAAYTGLEVEALLSVAAPEVAKVDPGPRCSILQTIEALFSRAAPSLSSYFYDVLDGDAVNELDE